MKWNAVVLAGGQGRRMWPFAVVRNKCAIPVVNVPNIVRVVDVLRRLGCRHVAVVVGEKDASIRHALRNIEPEPCYVNQRPDAGTAGAALAGLEALPEEEPAVIIAGDVVVTEETLAGFLTSWQDSGCRGAVLYDAVDEMEGGDWYSIHVDGERLGEIVGHEAGSSLRWCGIAAVDASFHRFLRANPGRMLRVPVGGMPPLEPDLAQSLNDWDAEVSAVRAAGFVVDMDKPWHILEANLRMAEYLTGRLQGSVVAEDASVDDGADIEGFVIVGRGSRIGRRVSIQGNVIIGENTNVTNGAILHGANIVGDRSNVRDYCLLGRGTVVGSDCIVGHGAEMDGVLFDGAYLYHYCEISGVVGASVDIGAATVCGTLRFDDGAAEHRVLGRRERPLRGANASYFGDHSRTGVNVITMPGVKIGAYSCVGAGIVLYEDVPDRTLLLLKQETVARPWGPERYGW